MKQPSIDRFNRSLLLTTAEAGDLLDLHASTIKRLCDDDQVPHTTTDGGHRRIHLADALEAARDRNTETFLDPFRPYEGHVWSALRMAEDEKKFGRIRSLAFSWLLLDRSDLVRPLLRLVARRPSIPYAVFVDEVLRELMREVGDAWKEGKLGVGTEHEATELVTDCLHGLREEWASQPDPTSVAVVGGLEKNRHDLGPLSIRLLLERAGWEVIYLGADVPLEEIAEIQITRGADLVCISVGPTDGRGGAVRALRLLSLLYRPESPYAIALGGEELSPKTDSDWIPDPLPFRDVGIFAGAVEFESWLQGRGDE
ncbi:MAG: cobalamin-dependent protein [Longimicrobiales bacterium]|nr:cobalamin-dependent protein [Longimicrobiales bacterium]